jgi:hypothetical protein
MLSQKFYSALRNFGKPFHKVAWEAGITPNQLYKISSGIDRPGPNDPRIIKLSKLLKLSIAECFEDGGSL